MWNFFNGDSYHFVCRQKKRNEIGSINYVTQIEHQNIKLEVTMLFNKLQNNQQIHTPAMFGHNYLRIITKTEKLTWK
jgi:hypothetical protein